MKVLIVDDDQFLLNMYSIKFKKSGFEVDAAIGATEALNKLREGKSPDVIMLDLVMPGMDGFELLAEIKKGKLAPNAAVVVLSNQGQSSDIDKAKQLGVDGYIVKATSIPSEVVEEVKHILAKKSH